ncbi:MAG: acylphosphatase [Parcubacteria group bacterium CG1_02_40_82]|uniref:acylphosphatase n=3 Tax=Candidatus Portnoyibacteriota TaxID=1817913 RepID=A0A2H0KV51_9BACT|nr:MAG: acylphosphatase [Parcubacteria group bacterium CG1_02_40_82]PIQ75284.1 MAG: acylphosphatase [Candidatus Portnoybacteria bacterium CG11_big_fil_rev_8_21_14_0_20_40_15]PIS30636.1 MAG: acylphosphatase [Candidatus Portnoybacteria bacterium CG08_land_8_20_14_0_20_40_83]PIY74823.1 MAG: acylphosphatase [Candidatus Portnoybacteria bacterium CG_4_10_14_0_8_um_filter_40_50]PJA64300.1 MAG: acylphosphatase [Candidatus Portnoybacteria bacterium CG_4_9_14_3_um_filter_40_10]
MNKRVIIKVSGAVQGVFFRAHIFDKAQEILLVGWVSNEPDGTVKIVVEGEEEKLKKFIEYCKEGPKFANVENLDVKWEEAKGEFEKFEIRYL